MHIVRRHLYNEWAYNKYSAAPTWSTMWGGIRGNDTDMIKAGDIMVKNPYSIEAGRKVALARLTMLRHNIGGMPVVDETGVILGIITLRDTDLAGADTSNLKVEDLMSRDLVTAAVDTDAREVARSMVETGYQRIPVVDADNRLIGLVTQTSIVKVASERLP